MCTVIRPAPQKIIECLFKGWLKCIQPKHNGKLPSTNSIKQRPGTTTNVNNCAPVPFAVCAEILVFGGNQVHEVAVYELPCSAQ